MSQSTATRFAFLLALLSCSWLSSSAATVGEPIRFASTPDASASTFRHATANDTYLATMRDRYGLLAIVKDQPTDLDKARALSLWVHNRLVHNGHLRVAKTDPMGILEEALLGHQVQCVEFGVVLAAALSAVGIPARPIYLRAADAATRGSAAGHVATEAWLRDQQKWALVDSQWDVIPMLGATPLSAVELQQALATNAPDLTFQTSTDAKGKYYFKWLERYLYYFDTPLDNRFGLKTPAPSLMLVPLGAQKLTVFQRTTRLRNMYFTHSAPSFYASPYEALQAQHLAPEVN